MREMWFLLFICCKAPEDVDQDGFYTPDDCDDQHAWSYPGAPEFRDGFDNNCDGLIDEGEPAENRYEGCGAESKGGQGGEVVVVSNLNDSGPGSLRDAVMSRSGVGEAVVPRLVRFGVSGEIVLESTLVVDQSYLTIDGASSEKGVTLRAGDPEILLFKIATVHDIIVSHLRFWGTWENGEGGHDGPGTWAVMSTEGLAHDIVLDHLSSQNAMDVGGDIWGMVNNVTVSWSMFRNSRHPSTISHHPEPFYPRDCISFHHNLFAHTGERNPQVRGDSHRVDLVNNLIYAWSEGGGNQEDEGSGIRIRADMGEPSSDVNVRHNLFIADRAPESALVFGMGAGAGDDGGPEASLMGDVFVEGNQLPDENCDEYSTVGSPLEVPLVTMLPASAVQDSLLRWVGASPYTKADLQLFEELEDR